MSGQTEQYAAQVETIVGELLATIEGLTDEQFQQVTTGEQWSVGVVAHHVAEVEGFFGQLLPAIDDPGYTPPSLAGSDIDANNAHHAQTQAGVTKQETLELLQANRDALVEAIRNLTEGDLGKTVFLVDDNPQSTDDVMQYAVIGHFQEHLASIRAAIAG